MGTSSQNKKFFRTCVRTRNFFRLSVCTLQTAFATVASTPNPKFQITSQDQIYRIMSMKDLVVSISIRRKDPHDRMSESQEKLARKVYKKRINSWQDYFVKVYYYLHKYVLNYNYQLMSN